MDNSPLVVILVHGLFGWGDEPGRQGRMKDYFYGVKSFLQTEVASHERLELTIMTPSLPPVDGLEVRGAALKQAINGILRNTAGVERVHLIAHSMGGLNARWVIVQDGMADKIASLTTLATAHRGTTLMRLAFDWLPLFIWGGRFLPKLGQWKRYLDRRLRRVGRGGSDPLEFYHHFLEGFRCARDQMSRALYPLTLKGCAEFNGRFAETERQVRQRIDKPVCYFSYGGRVTTARTIFLKPAHWLIRVFGTQEERASGNDGATSVWSAHYPWDDPEKNFAGGDHYVRTIPFDHYRQVNWEVPDTRAGDSMPPELQTVYREIMESILRVHRLAQSEPHRAG